MLRRVQTCGLAALVALAASFSSAASPGVPWNDEGRPARGPSDASVTIVFFDDPQCAHSARTYRMLFGEVLKDYADRVRVVIKEIPNSTIHPWATRASVNASCLARQSASAYWEFMDFVHSHQSEIEANPNLTLDRVALEAASTHRLAMPALGGCLESQPDLRIREAFRDARATGVTALPTLIVAGEMVVGAVPAPQLREVIDRAVLSATGAKPPPLF